MAPIVSTIEIDRPPETVFAYVTDPACFPQWQKDVVHVRVEGAGPAATGTRFTTTRRVGRTERTMTQEITRCESPRHWAARGVEGALRPHAGITVEPLDGGTRSRVTFSLDFEGRGAAAPLAGTVRRMAAKGAPASYRNAKNLLEQG